MCVLWVAEIKYVYVCIANFIPSDRVKASSHRHATDTDSTALSCPASGVNWAVQWHPFTSSLCVHAKNLVRNKKGKGSPYSITERMAPELIPVLCSQPAGDVSHKPGGRLPLLSARPAVTSATVKRAATSFVAW